MPFKHEVLYFYNSEGYEEKEIMGILHYRDTAMTKGVYLPMPHPIDRLVQHLQLLIKPKNQRSMMKHMAIDTATISRLRNGKIRFPPEWLVKMSDYSGLSIAELRAIGGLKPIIAHYTTFQQQELTIEKA